MTAQKLFEYTTEVEAEDGKGTEKVTLRLKPFNRMPLGVLRRNRKDPEGQMWDSLEWGLSEDQHEILDRIPASEIEELMEAWSTASEDEDKPTGKPKATED